MREPKKTKPKISESKPEEFTVHVTTASITHDSPVVGTHPPSENLHRILQIIRVCNIPERSQKAELSSV